MSEPRIGLIPALSYRDPKAAIAWLEKAFGFDLTFLIEDADGGVSHAQMTHGASTIMLGGEWSENHQSPLSTGGRNTQTVHVYVAGDVDAHCERARAAGGEILMEPATQFYGSRTYRCRDPEQHIWTISADVETVSVAEMEERSGLKIVVAK